MMSGAKVLDFDAYGLFRAAGPKVFRPHMSKLMWA